MKTKQKINRVVQILMDRDGMTEAEATKLVKETADEILESGSIIEADDIIARNLGLEPDYIMDIFSI